MAPAGRAPAASSTPDLARSADAVSRAIPFSRATTSLTDRQRAAVRRLDAAARDFHRIVDRVVRAPAWILEIQVLADRAEFVLAIRNARAIGLDALARRYQRVLDAELKRLDESRAFNALLARAASYREQVAQKAHEDNPNLSATALGNIAFNAANWYGNDALLKVTLRTAKRKGKTKIRYGGREGLHELPDANGGFNGGLIGLRRASETSAGKSPAIDIKTSNGTSLRIHVRHEP